MPASARGGAQQGWKPLIYWGGDYRDPEQVHQVHFQVDVVAAAVAPLASHPLCIQASAPLLRPAPEFEAIRDSEANALKKAFEAGAPKLRERFGALAVGVNVVDGQVTLLCYAPPSAAKRLRALTPALPWPAGYAPTVTAKPDPRWKRYFALVHPGDDTFQKAYPEALAQMRKLLAGLSGTAEFTYQLRFSDDENARRCARALRQLGFRSPRVVKQDASNWSLTAHAQCELTPVEAAKPLWNALSEADYNRGEVEGWHIDEPG